MCYSWRSESSCEHACRRADLERCADLRSGSRGWSGRESGDVGDVGLAGLNERLDATLTKASRRAATGRSMGMRHVFDGIGGWAG